MRVADYVISRLTQEGIHCLFMVNGRGVLYLTDAAARSEELSCVSLYHEQSAAYAAMAHAQYSNGLGACLVSTGCGAVNALTGALCAWQDDVPCIFLSGNNIKKETTRYTGIPLRTFGQQENDIIAVAAPLTKYAVMVTEGEQIGYELDKALYLAQHGRKGPVWIDIPLDVQDQRINPEELSRFVSEAKQPLPEELVRQITVRLKASKRPVLMLGNGVRSAGAIGELQDFLERCPIPVTYSTAAPDTIGAGTEHGIGAVNSMGGSRAGNFAVQNADFVLVLGDHLSTVTTSSEYKKFAREAFLVVVDTEAQEHKKNTVTPDIVLEADCKTFLQRLNCQPEVKKGQVWEEWQKRCKHWKESFPICEEVFRNSERVDIYELAEVLTELLPEEAVLCTDAGMSEVILPTNIRFREGQRLIHPNAQGAMGYALPAAIGACCAGARQVLVVVGDGSIMMNLQELQAIVFHQLPIRILVINNNGYATIRRRQKELFHGRTIGNDPSDGLGVASFERLAAAFDMAYQRILSPLQLKEGIKTLLTAEKPVICELYAVEEQRYQHCSIAKNTDGKLVRRSLEDQSPYLDRELFLREMVVEPIDQ